MHGQAMVLAVQMRIIIIMKISDQLGAQAQEAARGKRVYVGILGGVFCDAVQGHAVAKQNPMAGTIATHMVVNARVQGVAARDILNQAARFARQYGL